MTLAVAVLSPLPFHPECPKNSIILAADTRYSAFDITRRVHSRPPYDYGMKVTPVGSWAGVACAGDPRSATLAIVALEDYFRATPMPKLDVCGEELDEALAVANAESLRKRLLNYELLLAFISFTGQPALMHLSRDPGVGCSSHVWGAAIGQHQHASFFETAMKDSVEKVSRISGHPGLDPEHWLVMTSIALNDCIERNINPTVGGALQLGLLRRDTGFSPRMVYIGKRDAERNIDWKIATPDVSFDMSHVPRYR